MADESNEVSGSLTGAGAEGGVAAPVMSNLDRKITDDFSQYTVRKDLVSEVKGNALVPSYVLEYLRISSGPLRKHVFSDVTICTFGNISFAISIMSIDGLIFISLTSGNCFITDVRDTCACQNPFSVEKVIVSTLSGISMSTIFPPLSKYKVAPSSVFIA